MRDLALVNAAWIAARCPVLLWREVSSSEVNSLFIAWRELRRALVADETMIFARSLGWRIMRTITNTLHPFSCNHLGLAKLSEELARATSGKHATQLSTFNDSLGAVMTLAENPKGQCLEDIFCSASGESSHILVFIATDAGKPLGFPLEVREDLLGPYAGTVELVERVRDLDGRIADQLVLTSTPDMWHAPDVSWIYRIVGRGRPSCVQILHYAFERSGGIDLETSASEEVVYLGESRKQGFIRSNESPDLEDQDSHSGNEGTFLDEPDWQSLLQADSGTSVDGAAVGDAVHVAFANGRYAFIGLDQTVRRIGAGGKVDDVDIRSLEGGDLLALRDGASEDADLGELASETLRANGRSYSMAQASLKDWKAPLALALARYGDDGLTRAIRVHGSDVAPGRLRAWAGEDILAPLRFKDFLALLKALHRLSLLPETFDVPQFAADHWGNVTAIRNSRRRAGHELSLLLEQRLEEVMAEGQIRSGSTVALVDGDEKEGLRFVILEVDRIRVAHHPVPKSIWGRIRG